MACGDGEPGTAIVYVVDDDEAVRVALEDLLASVGLPTRSFGSVREFMDGNIDTPGCLVLDVRMPGMSGLEFQQRMPELGIKLPVIFITGHGDIPMSVRAMKSGAVEFLTKPFRDQDLIEAIQSAIAADRARRAEENAVAGLQSRWRSMTAGEQDVMRLVVQGFLNKQIAADLAVSEITVKVRRGNAMRKMGAASLADLVRMWDRLGQPG